VGLSYWHVLSRAMPLEKKSHRFLAELSHPPLDFCRYAGHTSADFFGKQYYRERHELQSSNYSYNFIVQ
jgi:hypothetical protein